MRIRIFNANILTMKDDKIIFGEIIIENNKIQNIIEYGENSSYLDYGNYGLNSDNERVKWDRQIDANGNLILPGFKNAHSHSGMTFLRSYADDLPLNEWLFDKVFPLEAKIKNYPEELYWCNILGNMEYLSSGITANFDMYIFNEVSAKASRDSMFRTVMVDSINDFGGTLEQLEEDYLKYNEYDELLSFKLGFHAEYTTKKETLQGIVNLAHKYKAPIFTHLSETKKEVDECVERYGKTPGIFLNDLGMFDYGGGGFHCVHLTEEEMEVLGKKDFNVVTNPAANLKLASGIAPIEKIRSYGINVAIGTDGPAGNNALDIFREMFLVTGLQKAITEKADVLDAFDVLKMATVGGAKAMGLDDADVLAPGKLADLVMLDVHKPNMTPGINPAKSIVYSGSKDNVKLTMVNGRILYEDGKFNIGVDPEYVYNRVNNCINKISE
ncbi:amidohydrolase [Eubacterium xylanophilum]|uniref:amidohydrolase n=1 Tax=Eubacterium xylanophilum TaxID=39497 RepID=UPI000479C770|nr:amidohydrolase [Eubacterium xylanophilum]